MVFFVDREKKKTICFVLADEEQKKTKGCLKSEVIPASGRVFP